MATTTRLLFLIPLLAATAACGSDGDSSQSVPDEAAVVEDGSGEPSDSVDATESDDTAESDDTTQPDDTGAEEDDAAPAPSGGDGGDATLTLANGEIFEFPSVLCTLEPQMAAGSEILFTATSYDDPGLDITQFGDAGMISDVASISVYDADFEILWEANSMLGSEVELNLDGSTVRGTGAFLPGPDLVGEPVEGEVVANC